METTDEFLAKLKKLQDQYLEVLGPLEKSYDERISALYEEKKKAIGLLSHSYAEQVAALWISKQHQRV